VVALGLGAREALAQGPTLSGLHSAPGSTASRLGPTPGAGGLQFGYAPGADTMYFGGGRPGPSFPRVPTSITTPSQTAGALAVRRGIAAPAALPLTQFPVYGSWSLPDAAEEEGPPHGLTLDLAIQQLLRDNLELRSRFLELPSARADILTAGLRANPILFADGQLVPYGRYNRDRSGGPTQYDLNVSHPLDLSGKRQARMLVAKRAENVLEAQYQDVVRLQIDNLHTAFLDVLASRETVRLAEASIRGLDRLLEISDTLFEKASLTRPDVVRARLQLEAAKLGLAESSQKLRLAKLTLANLLRIPAEEAESLEIKGALAQQSITPPSREELADLALHTRPDLAAHRLGIGRAEADVQLAKAEAFQDIYVLYQPYTFQDNSPVGLKSSTSWALGVTVPVPIFNRNQGGVARAKLNVTQTRIELSALEQKVVAEVIAAERELANSRGLLERLESDLLPSARQARDDALRLFSSGEQDAITFYNAQRNYNDAVRQYRDMLIRHRRSMLRLNTAVGLRLLP
jgi:cobalt-zinc-cadmium efflux system outer membrane protein